MSRSNELKIPLNEGYAWILFEVVLITIHIWITGMMMAFVRRRFFNKDFYQKQFPQYKGLSNVMKPDGGYPDDGQGRLADQLNDEQWFTFNNYRRAHMNYLEVCLIEIIFHCMFVLLGCICCDYSIVDCWFIVYPSVILDWNRLYNWPRSLFPRLSSNRFKRSSLWSIDVGFSSFNSVVNGLVHLLSLGKWFNGIITIDLRQITLFPFSFQLIISRHFLSFFRFHKEIN